VLRQHSAVLENPEPLVLVEELGPATVNLRIFYWFASATYSPAKINSALLRLTKDALLRGGIELPDPAREVVFPKGVPILRATESRPAGQADQSGAERVHSAGEEIPSTIGEGDLRNETAELPERSDGLAPEGEENLLKR
jgi:small-conductance mechanosensitive channel